MKPADVQVVGFELLPKQNLTKHQNAASVSIAIFALFSFFQIEVPEILE